MAAVQLVPEDLAAFATIDEAKATVMIEDAIALAARVAPCILLDDFAFAAAAKAILRGAILRWHDSGNGAVQVESAGPFGYTMDSRQPRRGLFWPSEIESLQELCATAGGSSGAFAIDTVATSALFHAEVCALNFGALYCSCGATLTGSWPLYELP